MKSRTAARLAWLAWIVAMALPLAMIGVSMGRDWPFLAADIALSFGFLILQLAFSTMGALVASRRYRNPIGWLFCAEGLALSVAGASEAYAAQALEPSRSVLSGEVAAWVSTWSSGALLIGPIVFVFLLFPDGRLASSWWRVIAWVAGGALVVSVLASAFGPGPLGNYESVTNPLGVEALGRIPGLLFAPAFLLLSITLFASAVGMIQRLRRARGLKRQQLKWLASAAALLGFAFVVGPITWAIPSVPKVIWPLLFLIAMGSLPVSAGIAILRYRLYDIDLIINRTLVYAVLTALLAIVYIAGVVGVGGLVRGMTGQERNTLVIAASTLSVAGLFRPARTRVQEFIDRRFYRSKYDAQRTIADFSTKMREQIDLDSLTSEMATVVRDTVQPTHVSLWLRS